MRPICGSAGRVYPVRYPVARAMKTLNLDPFWRTSVGFDRLFDLVDESLRARG
jgi:hypothetical protein